MATHFIQTAESYPSSQYSNWCQGLIAEGIEVSEKQYSSEKQWPRQSNGLWL